MEATPSIRARPMSELLPELSDGILSKECMRFLTAKKTHQEIIPTRNVRSAMKPLTMAEMRTEILALQVVQSPKRVNQVNRSARKKAWNSSVKVDKKTVSHTNNKQLQNKPVRKVLDFQAPTVPISSKAAGSFESVPQSTKFRKPESRVTKSMALQTRHDPRISGICKISETPVVTKLIKNRMTIANKVNFPSIKKPIIQKLLPSHAISSQKKLAVTVTVPDTPMSNDSWKSSCDASFLQAEKEINDIEEKTKALAEERTLDKLDDITPPASTPFIENRSIKEFFNPTSEIDNSVDHDDTIMNFDNPVKESREDSVIVSLCSLLNKATMKSPKNSSELDYLLHIEKLLEEDTNTIDNTIDTLKKMKDSHLQALQSIKKVINEKKCSKTDMDRTLIETKESNKIENTPKRLLSERSSKVKSVIVSPRSPSYKIPKKTISLQKKVVCKSMPNIANDMITPIKGDMGVRALSMYMKMKQHMNFLNTPVTKRNVCVMDTPAVTSHNLQNQLDKLYDEN